MCAHLCTAVRGCKAAIQCCYTVLGTVKRDWHRRPLVMPSPPDLHPPHSRPPAHRPSQALEERQRQLRAGDGSAPPRLTTQHLYNTVNAQMGIIQMQVRGGPNSGCM